MVHRETGHELAVKTIPIELQDDARRLLVQELRALSACNSPFVVQHFESFCNEGEVTIVMEYMDGGSLSSLVRRRHACTARAGSILNHAFQVCSYEVLGASIMTEICTVLGLETTTKDETFASVEAFCQEFLGT